MYCNKCGNELNEKDIFCNKCGNKVSYNDDKIVNEKTKDKDNAKKEIIVFVIEISIVILLIICCIYIIRYPGNIRDIPENIKNVFVNISIPKGNKDINTEYMNMKEFLNDQNMNNTNKYQTYLADIQKYKYKNYKAINPPSVSNIDSFKIEFLEEYKNYYIYKFETSEDVEYFSFSPLAHIPNVDYSNSTPGSARIDTYFEKGKIYYYAKNKNTNEYVNFEESGTMTIFKDATSTKDLDLLKSKL